jgi:hypothetical protein
MIKRPYRPHGFLLLETIQQTRGYSHLIDTKMRLTFGTLENQDDFSFEDFVICPEDYDLAGLS